MDKEAMAKANEILKKVQGRRELSMDEMDKVVGGSSWDTITVFGEEISMAEFNDMMLELTDKIGYYAAANVFESLTNHPAYGNDNVPISATTDRGKMESCLYEYWMTQKLGTYTPGAN